MAAPQYLAADFVAAMQALMPRGRAWPREAAATLTQVLAGFAESFEDSTAAANALIVDAFPGTSVNLLTEWEETLGLTSSGVVGGSSFTVESGVDSPLAPTTVGGLTTAQRDAAVVAALVDTGGSSASYFITLAAALGITITITQFSHYTVNSAVSQPITSDEWASVWQVNAPIAAAIPYSSKYDVVQATPGFGNPQLESLFGRAKPAHTVCIAVYS